MNVRIQNPVIDEHAKTREEIWLFRWTRQLLK